MNVFFLGSEVHGGMNRNTEQTNCPRTASPFTRFFCYQFVIKLSVAQTDQYVQSKMHLLFQKGHNRHYMYFIHTVLQEESLRCIQWGSLYDIICDQVYYYSLCIYYKSNHYAVHDKLHYPISYAIMFIICHCGSILIKTSNRTLYIHEYNGI